MSRRIKTTLPELKREPHSPVRPGFDMYLESIVPHPRFAASQVAAISLAHRVPEEVFVSVLTFLLQSLLI